MAVLVTAVVTGGCIRERRQNDGWVTVVPMNETPEGIDVQQYNETDLDEVEELDQALEAATNEVAEGGVPEAREAMLFEEDIRYLQQRTTYSASGDTVRGKRVKPGDYDVIFVRYKDQTFLIHPNLKTVE